MDNAGKLQDYSLNNNNAYAYGTKQVQEIYIREDPNNVAGHEVVSYFNGTHYVTIEDNARLRLMDIITNEPTKTGFTIVRRFNPLKYGNSKQDSVVIAQKTDSSSNKYAYSINMDDEGSIYFYVTVNYRQYFCKLAGAFNIAENTANFFMENYHPADYKTEYEEIQTLSNTLYDLACSFNFSTKEAKIQLRYKNNVLLSASSTSSTVIPQANLQLKMALQEGKWSTTPSTAINQVYDTTVNQHVGTVTNPDVSAVWQTDNTLLSSIVASGGTHISIPNHSTLTTLTEFSVSFWYGVGAGATPTTTKALVSKGLTSETYFRVERVANTSTLKATACTSATGLTPATVTHATSLTAGLWYFVTVKWKTGENVKMSINDGANTLSSTTQTGTISTTQPFKIFDVSSDSGTIINLSFYNRQLTAGEQTVLYSLGPHTSQLPPNLEPQRLPDPAPTPVTNPFSTLYSVANVATPAASDYVFLNDNTAASPYVSNYTCADGTPATLPEVQVYAAPTGVATVDSTSFDLTFADNGSNVLESLPHPTAGYRTRFWKITSVGSGAGSLLDGNVVNRISVNMKMVGSPAGSITANIYNTTGNIVSTLETRAISSLGLNTSTVTPVIFSNPLATATVGLNYFIGVTYPAAQGGNSSNYIQLLLRDTDADVSLREGASTETWAPALNSVNYELTGAISYKTPPGDGTTSTPTAITSALIAPTQSQSLPNGSSSISGAGMHIVNTSSGFGAAVNGKVPKTISAWFKKTGNPTGTMQCYIRDSGGTVVRTFGAPVNMSTFASGSATQETFEDQNNNVALASGYYIEFRDNMTYNNFDYSNIFYSQNGTDASMIYGYWTGNTFNTVSSNYDLGIEITYNVVTQNPPTRTPASTSIPLPGVTTYQPLAGSSYTGNATYNQITSSTSGIGLELNGRAVTSASFWLDRDGSPTGSLNCRIWNASGTVVKTIGASKDPSTIATSRTKYTWTDDTNTVVMGVGFRLGIEFTKTFVDDNNTINIHINDTDPDGSVREGYKIGSSFNLGNAAYDVSTEIIYIIETPSSGSGGTDAITQPYYVMGPTTGNYFFSEYVGSSDGLLGIVPTKISVRLKRNAAANGLLKWVIYHQDGTTRDDIGTASITVTDISTSAFAEHQIEVLGNTYSIALGDRVGMEWTGNTGGPTAEIWAMTNLGNNTGANNYNSSSSYFYQRSTGGIWTGNTDADMTGGIYYGNNTFTASLKFTDTVTRIYEKIVDTSSTFSSKALTRVKVRARRTGTIPLPGIISCNIREIGTNAIKASLGSVDANTIGTGGTYADLSFTNTALTYVTTASPNNYVSIEVINCDASNYIELNINNDVADGTHSVAGTATVSLMSDLGNYDLAGTFYTGGLPDATSRLRVSQFINAQGSLFLNTTNNQVTFVQLYLTKIGSPTGTVTVHIRRGVDDSDIKQIGSIAVSSITTTSPTPTVLSVTDTTNTYILEAKDKISVEYAGGDASNAVGVQVRNVTPSGYDGTNSYIARYNGSVYDYDTTRDMVALMKVGGNTFTPEANAAPPVMPQSSTNVYLGVSGDKTSLYEKAVESAFIFTTEILTDTQLNNLYSSRNDIETTLGPEILTTNYTYILAP